jgi:hypothetical protein
MPKKPTRATGTKTKKWYSKSVDKAAGKYASNYLKRTYPGGEEGFLTDLRGSNPSKARSAFYDAELEGRIHRAENYMPNKSVTKVTYNKPEKKLQTGRDIPLPKSNF